jgi:phosphoglycerate kinase
MRKKTIRDIDVAGKRVLLRVDYNVQVEDGVVFDDLRLRESLPTLQALREAGARIVIGSHRGRPRGEVVPDLRNAPVAQHLQRLLDTPVRAVDDCVGADVEVAVAALEPGEILMLENLRFHPEESANDPGFAAALARLGDVFVNDAFGTAHRAHASVVGVAQHLPAVAGLLLEREVDVLEAVTRDPQRPLGIVLGGSKIADKVLILEHLIEMADVVCVGGAMANTFLKALGTDVADSLVEDERLDAAARCVAHAARHNVRMVLPTDVVAAFGAPEGGSVRTLPVDRVPAGWRILDVGPATIRAFHAALTGMRTAIWNGPLGLFEQERFAEGSLAMARILANLDGTTVVGGGETAAAVQRAGVADRITHVSTGGGASLMLMQGRALPGVDALLDADLDADAEPAASSA